MDSFRRSGKYSAQIASHKAEIRREGGFTDQGYLSISSLQTDYINIYSSSGSDKNSERENLLHTKVTFCGGANHSTEKNSKGSERKREKLARLVNRKKNVQNTCLANFSDADMKMT